LLEDLPCLWSHWEISVGCHLQATLTVQDFIRYAAPAWWRFLSVPGKDRIESVINKAQRYGSLLSRFENIHSLVLLCKLTL